MNTFILPARAGAFVVAVFAVFAVFVSLLFSAGAHAQSPSPDDDDLVTILITASRFAETADETLAPVTVITRKEIEEKQAQTVEEVLRAVPGVTLSNNGGVGKVTTLFLRGTNSNHVLVLVDGVKVGSATTGLTPFQHIPLAQVEKIEVVRGPRSSLYGSEAIGGVIQIFTRKGGGAPRPRVTFGGGSHAAANAEFGLAGGTRRGGYGISFSTESTNGYDACRASFCRAETDDDGYKSESVSLRGDLALTDNFSVDGNFFMSDSDAEFDGFYDESESTVRAAGVTSVLRLSDESRLSLQLGQSRDKSRNTKTNQPSRLSVFDTTRNQATLQGDFRFGLGGDRLIAGVDYLKDRVRGTTDYTVSSRKNTGVFALLRIPVRDNDFEASLRHDNNQQFGDKITGSAAWGRDFGGGNRVTVSYGTGFKAPDFNVLYEPARNFGSFGIFRDNPDLKPETSRTVDAGFSHRGSRGRFAVNVFRTTIDNLIVSQRMERASMPPITMPVNIEQAEITGLEISAGASARGWEINGAATWQNTEETKGDNKGRQLLKRPKRKLSLDVGRQFGKHRLGAGVFAQSASYDFGFVKLSGFGVVNLFAESRISRDWTLGVKVNNAFDKAHETAKDYPQDGRNFLVTLRYAP